MDIVKRLRKSANTIYKQDGYTFRFGLQNEAADEIERLREALEDIAKEQSAKSAIIAADLFQRIARAALKEGE